jgi:hypothetical protein
MALASQDRPLGVQEAYDALEAFGRSAGRVPLLLLLHAAVPQSFRADLVNLLKQNFLASEAGTDMTVDADVLLSPLVQPAAGNYYRLDPEVRRHCLALLDAAYRDRPVRRSVEVAWFLMAYAEALEEQAGLALDPLLAEYLDVQRWVAASFIDPGAAAASFARAIADRVASARTTASALLGSIAAAISVPLSGQEALLTYARGLDAVERGDAAAAERLLGWTRDNTLVVGGVTLEPGSELLARLGTQPTGGSSTAAQNQTNETAQAPPASTTPERATEADVVPRFFVPSSGPPMIGRLRELELASTLLTRPAASRSGPRVVRIVGEDGMGKWTLANALVNRTNVPASFPDGVVWLGEDGSGYPIRAIKSFAGSLGVSDLLDDRELVRPERFRQMLAGRRVLFVVDHRSASDIAGTVIGNAGPECGVLHLVAADRTDNPNRVILEPLSLAEAKALIERVDSRALPVAEMLHGYAGGNPLLITIACQDDISIREGGTEVWEKVDRLIESLWQRLTPPIRMALRALNALRPEHRTVFPKREIADLSASVDNNLAAILQHLNLADDLGEDMRVHPHVRAALIRAGLTVADEPPFQPVPPQVPSRTDDYAMVVAIGDYHGLGLKIDGASAAAHTFIEWLSSAQGGGIPRENLTSLVQDPSTSDQPQPSHDAIQRALVALAESVQPSRLTRPPRRLYLYFCGAVMSGGSGEVGLLTSDATSTRPRTAGILEWRRFFRDGPFTELAFILVGVQLPSSPVATISDSVPATPGRSRESARVFSVELLGEPSSGSDDNATTTIIEGLRGAASDERGRVTSKSLAAFLDKSLRSRPWGALPPRIELSGDIDFTEAQGPPPA